MDPQRRTIIGIDVGVKNLAYCVISVGAKEKPNGGGEEGAGATKDAIVVAWKVVALAAPKEKIPPLGELSGRLFLALDELCVELDDAGYPDIDTVLIENQPSRLNGSMKTMQVMIYSYYQLRKLWEGKVREVLNVAASQKIAPALMPSTPEFALPEIPKGKTGYALNKWKAVQYGNMFIAGDDTLRDYIKKYKKADDAHDAMLHIVAWLRRNGSNITRLSARDGFEA